MVIRELYSWDQEIPAGITSIPGFEGQNVWHQETRFVDLRSGELQDVHDYYFLTGEGLEKVKRDFKADVMRMWQLARAICPEFPHHTNGLLDDILDPAVDGQAKWGPDRFSYAWIETSTRKSHAATVQLLSETTKGSTSFRTTISYDAVGKVVGVDSWITRKNMRYFLVLKNSASGMYISEIRVEKSMYGHVKENDVVFSSRGAKQFRASVEEMGLDDLLITSQGASGCNMGSRKALKPKRSAKPTARGKSPRHDWTEEEEIFILAHPEMSQSELAKRFNVTVKSVERKRAKLRSAKPQ